MELSLFRKGIWQQVVKGVASRDPDSDPLAFKWWHYREAGTYPEVVSLEQPRSTVATVTVPDDLGTHTIHLIREARDNGSPALVAYRRVILTAGGP